jgi:ribosomal protein S18 acetylase RimI-like enzyme
MFLIRPYTDADFEPYAETLLRTWPLDNIEDARETVTKAVERVKTNGKEEIWVAEFEGKPAGFILLDFTKIWGHEGESFENEAVCIDWFDVNPEFQRKGIAKELLLKAEERGNDRGLHQVFMHTSVDNLPMINFASKNGFRFEKYLKGFMGNGTGDAFLLIKEL